MKKLILVTMLILFSSTTQADNSAARQYFPDVELINQDGQKMRFYSDLIQGKVVVINTIFTTCTSICPPMMQNYAAIQDALGDRLGKEVHLISISVDPITDTPPRLKAFADNYHAKPGWYLMTGNKENVDTVLYKLGQFVQEKEDHTSIMLMGNEPTGLWKKAFGLAKSEELIQIVESVLNDKG